MSTDGECEGIDQSLSRRGVSLMAHTQWRLSIKGSSNMLLQIYSKSTLFRIKRGELLLSVCFYESAIFFMMMDGGIIYTEATTVTTLLPSSGKGGYNTVWYILIFYKWHMKLLLIIFNHELIWWDMNKSQGLENAKVTVWIFTFEISIPVIWCSYVQCMNICDIMCCSDFYLRERFLPSCSGGSVLLFGHKQHILWIMSQPL